ncbi:replicative DNA helicase [Cytobacillus spongiae]|uniref:replicative DNA helicase n=1 Tax=Cytobacillus spongiae TaxID=2901381 RepID=UPI001F1BF66F|nr:replicative DNA helicase [Cytobacillus spongiae]UII57636.1 replicative DNA helicase [Cytobacillus spongiae]
MTHLAEKAFLGSLMKSEYLLKDTVVQPGQLESTRHQALMRKMVEYQLAGKHIDLITLTTLPNLESFGGMSYLSELITHADLEKFESIEKLLLDLWKEREKRSILTLASVNDWEIERVSGELDKISHLQMDNHTSIQRALMTIYEAPWENLPLNNGISTGFKELDEITGGFQEGEVTIIAARPSMGKTDVMLHFAKVIGWAGYLPLIFSLEMPEKLVTSRLVASTGGFNRGKMRDPKQRLSQRQKDSWAAILGNLTHTNIQIFDGAGQTIPEIRANTRKMIHQYPQRKPVVFIDYLSLIHTGHTKGGNPHQQITEVSKSLKTMAKDFNCPVICLAQLNRSVESRADKRPMMSDIRESGSVEQDADVILFLYRERYYDKSSMNFSLDFIISKNRNGPVGTVSVKYNEHTGEIVEKNESDLPQASDARDEEIDKQEGN